MEIFQGDKMNIATLGNIVPQCHIHHVVRYQTDIAWPAPIWGKYPAKAYTDEEIATIKARLQQAKLKNLEFS